MDVKLYYIEGISRIDTPYFFSQGSQATLAKQQAYFETKRVLTLSTSFYPPHYMNEIKFDIGDVDFTDTVNYLSLTFGDKDYYYFIDAIEYLNEAVIKLHVTMDVIQTYMFNIRVSNGIIERKFINRWYYDNASSKWLINRNYIRENVSEGIFYPVNHQVVNSNPKSWVYVFKATERPSDGKNIGTSFVIPQTQSLSNWLSNDAIPTPIVFFFLPYYNETKILFEDIGTTNSFKLYPTEAICRLVQHNYIIDAYAIPFNPFLGLEVNSVTGDFTISKKPHTSEYCYDSVSIDNPNDASNAKFRVLTSRLQTPSVDIGSDGTINASHYVYPLRDNRSTINYSASMTRNSTLLEPFNSKYITELFDSNYVKFVFGSNYANTTIPLEKLEQPLCYYHYYCDVVNGNLIYSLTEGENRLSDKYRTTVVDSKFIGLIMKNSPWQDYVSQNRSRWIGAIGETALDITTKAAMLTVGMGEISGEQQAILSNPKSLTPVRRKLSAKAARQINALALKSETMQKESAVDIASSAVGGVLGQALHDYNNYVKPCTSASNGNLEPLFDTNCQIYYQVQKVQDYEVCANFFHRNGYLVNEHVNAIADIFSYVNTRFYFNVLKMSDVDLHLSGVIEDTSTLEIIKDRLNQGLRLWNIINVGVAVRDVDVDVSWDTDPYPFVTTADALIDRGLSIISLSASITGLPEGATVNTPTYNSTTGRLSAIVNVPSYPYSGMVRFTYTYNYINSSPIGDFTYDNVELDYLN